jgi:hypothetical protein
MSDLPFVIYRTRRFGYSAPFMIAMTKGRSLKGAPFRV